MAGTQRRIPGLDRLHLSSRAASSHLLLLLACLPLLVGGKLAAALAAIARSGWRGGVDCPGAAAWLFHVANPDAFWVRITQVAPDDALR